MCTEAGPALGWSFPNQRGGLSGHLPTHRLGRTGGATLLELGTFEEILSPSEFSHKESSCPSYSQGQWPNSLARRSGPIPGGRHVAICPADSAARPSLGSCPRRAAHGQSSSRLGHKDSSCPSCRFNKNPEIMVIVSTSRARSSVDSAPEDGIATEPPDELSTPILSQLD